MTLPLNPASRVWPDWPRDVLIIPEEYEMPKTLHDRLVAALTAEGFTHVKDHRSTKFTVMVGRWSFANHDTTYYVGRAGALRFGHSASTSIPASAKLKTRLLGLAIPSNS